MLQSSVTSKGQITIPVECREALHIEPGDKVEFIPRENGVFVKKRISDITAAFGLLKTDQHISLEDMEAAIQEGATDSFRRTNTVKNNLKVYSNSKAKKSTKVSSRQPAKPIKRRKTANG